MTVQAAERKALKVPKSGSPINAITYMAHLRRFITTAIIRLGPRNPLVHFLIDRKCRQFGATLIGGESFLTLRKDRREMRLAQKHFVYAPELAERFDMYFNPLVPADEGGYSVLDYSRPGVLQTYVASRLQFEMSAWPEEEEAIEGYFRWYRPKPGDTVFDMGANCGVSSYHFSKLVGPGGRVIAFEPDPVNLSLLCRNIERHQLKNVIPVQIAVASTRGKAEFSCEESLGSVLMRQSTRDSVGNIALVETITLEDAFVRWGHPAFCKIDIEGSELEVIGAARDFLRNHPCQFALDTNHFVGGSLTDNRIEHLFRECGYEATSSDSGLKTTWARPSP